MLKQFSVPKKVFGTITLLLAICYVGVMVYIHDTSADWGKETHWVYYKARVNNITRSGNTFTVNTVHTVRYDNHHENHGVDFSFRHSPQWVNETIDGAVENEEENTPETMVDGEAYGTHVTYRSESWEATAGNIYKAGAYTNLFYDDWDNATGELTQAEVFTDGFTTASFVVDSVPAVPVEDTERSNHP